MVLSIPFMRGFRSDSVVTGSRDIAHVPILMYSITPRKCKDKFAKGGGFFKSLPRRDPTADQTWR
jgi:hypothetical protein